MPRGRNASPGSDEESEESEDRERPSEDGREDGKDPRTISQIKRSRIDLDRRYVFLCPSHLSKHFDVLPHQAKDSALLVFRCSRSWVFQDAPRVRNARTKSRVQCWTGVRMPKVNNKNRDSSPSKSRMMGVCLYQSEFSKEFLQWVQTKEKEGCVFWYKPDRDLKKLSEFFEEKIDPMNEQPYRPLLLDPQWWRVRFMASSAKFCLNPNVVVAALAGAGVTSHPAELASAPDNRRDIDIPALQELIYQSNPTLEPVARWPHAPSMRFVPRAPPVDHPTSLRFCKGYIDQDRSFGVEPGRFTGQEQSRIERWPQAPKERHDDLHRAWIIEDAASTRRHHFNNTLPPLSSR